MIRHGRKSSKPNIALSDAGMAVLVATQSILAIINMNSTQLAKAYNPIKLL